MGYVEALIKIDNTLKSRSPENVEARDLMHKLAETREGQQFIVDLLKTDTDWWLKSFLIELRGINAKVQP